MVKVWPIPCTCAASNQDEHMINLHPVANQAAVCHPPITHHLLFMTTLCYLSTCIPVGGGFLSDCPANMPCLGGPALTWQSDRSVVLCPRIQAKYVEICSDSMRNIFVVTDSTAQFKTHWVSRQISIITQMHYQALQTAFKVSLHCVSSILIICRIVA